MLVPHRDRSAAVILFGQGASQEFGGVRFEEDAGLEVEARREVEVGVRRAREAVAAAMLAASVGVDRLVEGNVRGVVARDDGSGFFGSQGCFWGLCGVLGCWDEFEFVEAALDVLGGSSAGWAGCFVGLGFHAWVLPYLFVRGCLRWITKARRKLF